jgi:DNA-binding transcriptional ArsR family regulator
LAYSAQPQSAPVERVKITDPRHVIEDPKLTTTARVLYQLLVNAADRRGIVETSRRELAVRVGVTEDRISTVATELRNAGLLESRQGGRTRLVRYTLLGIALAAAALAPMQMSFVDSRTLRETQYFSY